MHFFLCPKKIFPSSYGDMCSPKKIICSRYFSFPKNSLEVSLDALQLFTKRVGREVPQGIVEEVFFFCRLGNVARGFISMVRDKRRLWHPREGARQTCAG